MGAVVLRTYFFVAHPPASKAPVKMHVVVRKAFIFKNLVCDTCNLAAVVDRLREFKRF
jgi:hypothetical protein